MARASTPRQAPRKRKATELVVSLDEFASICGVTPETMRKHLKDAPASADWLLERGRRGVGYKIAAAGGVEWWRSRSAAGGGEDQAKLAAIAEMRLELLGDVGDDEGLLLTGKQRFEEFRAGREELEFREAIGELCRVAEIEGEIVNAVIELRRQLQGVGATIRKRFGLEREVEIAIDEAIADRLTTFIAKIDADVDDAGD